MELSEGYYELLNALKGSGVPRLFCEVEEDIRKIDTDNLKGYGNIEWGYPPDAPLKFLSKVGAAEIDLIIHHPDNCREVSMRLTGNQGARWVKMSYHHWNCTAMLYRTRSVHVAHLHSVVEKFFAEETFPNDRIRWSRIDHAFDQVYQLPTTLSIYEYWAELELNFEHNRKAKGGLSLAGFTVSRINDNKAVITITMKTGYVFKLEYLNLKRNDIIVRLSSDSPRVNKMIAHLYRCERRYKCTPNGWVMMRREARKVIDYLTTPLATISTCMHLLNNTY